jgi:hypothetical protein
VTLAAILYLFRVFVGTFVPFFVAVHALVVKRLFTGWYEFGIGFVVAFDALGGIVHVVVAQVLAGMAVGTARQFLLEQLHVAGTAAGMDCVAQSGHGVVSSEFMAVPTACGIGLDVFVVVAVLATARDFLVQGMVENGFVPFQMVAGGTSRLAFKPVDVFGYEPGVERAGVAASAGNFGRGNLAGVMALHTLDLGQFVRPVVEDNVAALIFEKNLVGDFGMGRGQQIACQGHGKKKKSNQNDGQTTIIHGM